MICLTPNLANSDWVNGPNFTTTGAGCKLSPDQESTFSDVNVFPNPFSFSTTISFSLAENSHVILELLDITGKKIDGILETNLEAGINSIQLYRDHLSSGIYFLRLKVNEETSIMKFIVQ